MASDPGALMTSELLAGFIVERRKTISDNTTYNNLRMLRLMLNSLCPGVDWNWIGQQGVAPRRWEAKAARRKPRQFPVAVLLAKLIEAMRQVIGQPTDLKSSVRMRDCLVVAVGVITSLRLRNLSNMRLERNLIRRPNGWEILFDRAETKNGEPFLSYIPEALCPLVERYITVEWVRLTANREVPTDAVWPSMKGGGLARATIRQIFTQITTEFLGYAINPHPTRSAMATRILTDDPRALSTASLALTHSDIGTVTQFYDESGSRLAQEKYLEIIAHDRGRSARRIPRGGRRSSGLRRRTHRGCGRLQSGRMVRSDQNRACSQQSNATAWAGLPRQPEPRRAARNAGLRFDRAIRSRLRFGGLHLLWWLKLFGLLGLRLIIDRHREQPPP
jgi:integrase